MCTHFFCSSQNWRKCVFWGVISQNEKKKKEILELSSRISENNIPALIPNFYSNIAYFEYAEPVETTCYISF